MAMIKDNHISVAGGIKHAMKSVDQFLEKENLALPVEVQFSDCIYHVKDVTLHVFTRIPVVHFFFSV